MKPEISRARLLTLIFGCILCIVLAGKVWSQPAYPTKPINLIISYGAGGTVDTCERFLANRAEKLLGQPFVITNNGGGGSAVAVGITATKPPDGYNIVGCASTGLIRIPQFRVVPYKPDDLVPIMHFGKPVMTPIVIKSSSPWKSFKELIDFAKKNPGKVTYGTPGVGSPMHLAMEYIAKQEGLAWTHVPYPGGMPALLALLGGHVTAQLGSGESIPHVKEGTLRYLAFSDEKRVKAFPEVPTMRELGYDVINESVFMFAAPKGTPQYIIDKLDNAFHKAMLEPEFDDLMARMEFEPSYRNSADTQRYLDDAYTRIGRMIKELKIPKQSDEKK